MLYIVQEICKKHNIKYFVDGGTMLGAIRHRGFIPWDNDIDVMMLREDYDEFLKVCKEEKYFNDPYFLQNEVSDTCWFGHTKVRRSDTAAILFKDVNYELPYNQGIFIDIFVFDRIPTEVEHFTKFFDELYCTHNLMVAAGNLAFVHERDGYIGLLAKEIEKFEKLRIMYNNDTSLTMTANLGLISQTQDVRKPLITFTNPAIQVPFEFLTVPVPQNYDQLLTVLYGNWKIPAQDNSRHGNILFDTEKTYLNHSVFK